MNIKLLDIMTIKLVLQSSYVYNNNYYHTITLNYFKNEYDTLFYLKHVAFVWKVFRYSTQTVKFYKSAIDFSM